MTDWCRTAAGVFARPMTTTNFFFDLLKQHSSDMIWTHAYIKLSTVKIYKGLTLKYLVQLASSPRIRRTVPECPSTISKVDLWSTSVSEVSLQHRSRGVNQITCYTVALCCTY